jgi:hypothetical protein
MDKDTVVVSSGKITANLRWIIRDYKGLYQPRRESLDSPIFEVGEYSWRIQYYHGGNVAPESICIKIVNTSKSDVLASVKLVLGIAPDCYCAKNNAQTFKPSKCTLSVL